MTESILTIVSAIVLLGIVALILKYARRSAKITEKVAALAERSYELRLIDAAERGILLPARPPIATTRSTISDVSWAVACRFDALARRLDPSLPSKIYPVSVDPSASATASNTAAIAPDVALPQVPSATLRR